MAIALWGCLFLVLPAVLGQTPLSIPPSQYWDGNDGPWSSFKATVGTPPQNVRVYPASSQSSLWVVLPEGCTGDEPQDCSDARGFLFQKNASSTWSEKGLFELTTTEENFLGLTGNGDWGFDTVMLGWQGDGLPNLNSTLVTGVATPDFYLGEIGLNNQPLNFTTFNDPQPSLLATLKAQGRIPSLSWGYTAGASYQRTFGFGSLTLGGYDTTRFSANDLTIPFGPDSSRDLLVAIQTIRTSNTQAQLLPKPEFFWIDSTVSQIWLPADACTAFETAFGISWDDESSLYLVNDTLHDQLVSQNPNVTFRLGSELDGGTTVDITFPYSAFDLNVSLPLVNGSSRYFPLKRAANETQYVLGRAFLQEAYVTVDYERSSFQVQQAIFPGSSTSQKLVAIQSPNATASSNTSDTSTSSQPSKLSTGAEAGIIAGGSIVGVAVVVIAVILCIHQRRKKQKAAELSADPLTSPPSFKSHFSSPSIGPPSEMDPFGKVELPVATDHPRHELEGYYGQRNELQGEGIHKAEMMGSPIKDSHPTNKAMRQNLHQDLDNFISVHELPAHVPVPELDSSTNTASTNTVPRHTGSLTSSSTTGVRSPISSASGSSPATGLVSTFPRYDRNENQEERYFGGWI
ncbi:acid protease [Viridothelium virens]|uniref:Acid protease n=1 Tax=Viridothelium virens TaxID=1048519 RepID=A0A6A6H0C2_VIRVR|nr:acid protease [Viridothelium virens]